ncbi:hypothetical protein EV426DRAFT_587887 [Tirmania nivea]|nr:hypothetical protein EV426DRAFT_587887 [Tirmania nivea]
MWNRGAAVDAAGSSGRTLLSRCAGHGTVAVCKMLLARGAQVDTMDSSVSTPLSYCARHLHDGIDICDC